MRTPNENEDLSGKVCVCNSGRLVLVVREENFYRHGFKWTGVGLDGRGFWMNRFNDPPAVLYDSIIEFLDVISQKQTKEVYTPKIMSLCPDEVEK